MGCVKTAWLLAPEAKVSGAVLEVAAKRIDINTATTLIARVDTQFLRMTAILNIDEHSLYAGFVEIIVFAK